MLIRQILDVTKKGMEKCIEDMQRNLAAIRTGRASVSILDHVQANYYGTPTPLNQMASLSTPESSMIVIQPWDTSSISAIEKAILQSNIGLTPQNDGNIIRATGRVRQQLGILNTALAGRRELEGGSQQVSVLTELDQIVERGRHRLAVTTVQFRLGIEQADRRAKHQVVDRPEEPARRPKDRARRERHRPADWRDRSSRRP